MSPEKILSLKTKFVHLLSDKNFMTELFSNLTHDKAQLTPNTLIKESDINY